MSTTITTYKRGPAERRSLVDGPLGAILLLEAEASGGRFSLVEHPIAPRTLGAPVHTHTREDEYSLVLDGTVGFEVGGEAFAADAGEIVLKPRGIAHAFWNPTEKPARILELIVPGGFEEYFAELGEILAQPGPPDLAVLGRVAARYELAMEPESVGRLAAEHGLVLPG